MCVGMYERYENADMQSCPSVYVVVHEHNQRFNATIVPSMQLRALQHDGNVRQVNAILIAPMQAFAACY
jgi:hypothetical protein